MKLKIFLLFLVFTSLFLSCKEEEIQLQIPEEEMVKILTDLHISEAAILSLNQKIKDSISVIYYDQIFKIHGVTDSIFYRDLEILRKDAKRLDEVYQKVIVEIEQLDVAKDKEENKDSPKKK